MIPNAAVVAAWMADEVGIMARQERKFFYLTVHAVEDGDKSAGVSLQAAIVSMDAARALGGSDTAAATIERAIERNAYALGMHYRGKPGHRFVIGLHFEDTKTSHGYGPAAVLHVWGEGCDELARAAGLGPGAAGLGPATPERRAGFGAERQGERSGGGGS